MHSLQKWCDLPTILQKDRKKILPSEGEGISLIESIITCLWEGYDIGIGYSKMIQFLATEISSKPAYTKYMKDKPSLDDIIFNLTLKEKDEYAKYAVELYMSQLWAGGLVIPGLTSSNGVKPGRSMRRVVMATQITTVMNTISILWAVTHKPHRKVAGLVLSVLVITSSRAIWLSG